MKKEKIVWEQNGWTTVQKADKDSHTLEVSCRTESGMIVEVRARHHDGEEVTGKVCVDGKEALPMSIKTFEKHFAKGEVWMMPDKQTV